MNREIKFRGKSGYNGEWVYGNVVYSKKPNGGISVYIINGIDFKENEDGVDPYVTGWHQVFPNSVGQYAGLKDKNGKEIYEGDIVCDKWRNCYTPIFRNGIYMAYNTESVHLKLQEPSTQFNVIWKDGCEIIGNIHDNPELLGE